MARADAERPAEVGGNADVERLVSWGAGEQLGGVVLVLQLEAGVRVAFLLTAGQAYECGNALAVAGAQAAEISRVDGVTPGDDALPGDVVSSSSDPRAREQLERTRAKSLEGRGSFMDKRAERQAKLQAGYKGDT